MTSEPGPGPAEDPISRVLASFHEEVERGVSSRAEFEALKGRYLGREKGLVPQLGNLLAFVFATAAGLPVARCRPRSVATARAQALE